MQPTDPDHKSSKPEPSHEDTFSDRSALELSNVKDVLLVKMGNPESHYKKITQIGKGSFGEVYSARDTVLGRNVAIKSLKFQYRNQDEVVDRFLKEARGTAQLEHPNIMPVHEMGVTDDLGVYFTMKKIEGEDLKIILDQLESGSSTYLKKYPLNTLLEIFLSVCNGVAFAHSKGVIHRDLKPANIMIGEYGEVLILDWGLVKQVGGADEEQSTVKLRMEEFDGGNNTLEGAVSGTPNYMSPEQAEGRNTDIDFQSDIYSLGAILYHLLTHLPAFERTQLRKLLENVKLGRFKSPRKRRPELNIPRELDAICLKAMSRFPDNRYRSVERFSADIRNYINHREVSAYRAPHMIRFWKACRRNPIKASVIAGIVIALGLAFGAQRAMLMGSYRTNLRNAAEMNDIATADMNRSMELYTQLKHKGGDLHLHTLSPNEESMKAELTLLIARVENNFNIAQSYYEGVPLRFRQKPGVRKCMMAILDKRIQFDLDREEYALAQSRLDEVDTRVERWGREPHPDVTAYIASVKSRILGNGSLEISGPESVQNIVLFAYTNRAGRLILDEDFAVANSRPPIQIADLRKGSYGALVTLADGSLLSYPIFLEHGENKLMELLLPPAIPEGMCFIPAGEFIFGGGESRFYSRQKRTLDSFYIKKTEVTFGEYLEFWKGLTDERLIERYQSRIQFKEEERLFHNAWDSSGELRFPDQLKLTYPIVGITREAANAYCVWLSEKRNAVIRLPSAEEWEKAARGVDGRTYVWGSVMDPRFSMTKYNLPAKVKYPFLAPPGHFGSTDISVYNVMDMAGNVREMTSTLLPTSTDLFQLKGGSGATPENFLPCSYSSDTPVVPSDVGFRYVMEL